MVVVVVVELVVLVDVLVEVLVDVLVDVLDVEVLVVELVVLVLEVPALVVEVVEVPFGLVVAVVDVLGAWMEVEVLPTVPLAPGWVPPGLGVGGLERVRTRARTPPRTMAMAAPISIAVPWWLGRLPEPKGSSGGRGPETTVAGAGSPGAAGDGPWPAPSPAAAAPSRCCRAVVSSRTRVVSLPGPLVPRGEVASGSVPRRASAISVAEA